MVRQVEQELFPVEQIEDESTVPEGTLLSKPRTAAVLCTRVVQLREQCNALELRNQKLEAENVLLLENLQHIMEITPEISVVHGKHYCLSPWSCNHTGCETWRAIRKTAARALDDAAMIHGHNTDHEKSWDDKVRVEVARRELRDAKRQARLARTLVPA